MIKIEKTDLARDALYEKVNAMYDECDNAKQDKLVSGTNIKTIGGESLLGSGDIEVGTDIPSMTLAEYNAMPEHDPEQYFAITDDSDVSMELLKTIYPVGSLYITTNDTCPLANLFGTWSVVATNVVTNVNTSVPVKGTGSALGLTNSSGNFGMTIQNYTSHEFAGLQMNNGAYGKTLDNTTYGRITSYTNSLATGVTTDASKSGVVGTVTRTNLTLNIFKRIA